MANLQSITKEAQTLLQSLAAGGPTKLEVERMLHSLSRRSHASIKERAVVHGHWRDVWYLLREMHIRLEDGRPIPRHQAERLLTASLSRIRRRLMTG